MGWVTIPSTQDEILGKRTKNFTPIEDVLLCRAYVNISQDPIKGNDQKIGVLWENIYTKFIELKKDEGETEVGHQRDITSIMNRFKRHISKDVQLFNGMLGRIRSKKESGSTPELEN